MSKFTDYLSDKQTTIYKNKVKKIANHIEDLIKQYEPLSDDELLQKINKIKGNQLSSKQFTDLLPEVYAITSIFSKRVLGMMPYNVQLQGAITLFDHNIAEMKTGEGKTLTSAFPVVLAAIGGKKVHVVTVNEYLARRDKEILEPLYKKLGLTVGLNTSALSPISKQKEYDCDIMYSTPSELGFDYLRDNTAMSKYERVNKHGYQFAFIDEVDLVLIDEARTPLIIGRVVAESDKHSIIKAQHFMSRLKPKDYSVNHKNRTVSLTISGETKAEKYFKINNLYNLNHSKLAHRVHEALLANFLYVEDVDYAVGVENGKKNIQIIDVNTGRISVGRRFMAGLHQALEAKHYKQGVEIQDENKSAATITLQNYFRLYEHLSGMSGTASEERVDFTETYGLGVVKIDTNKPVIREDKPIVAFSNKKEKWNYLVDRILYYHKLGEPILVGTVSVEDSETVSKLLRQRNLKHQVLNAKQDKREADIISLAGRKNAITIATNMAGRGTDIKVNEENQLVVFLTELNESSRIDNQLKGRTSRQGARGITETIISLEDSIFSKSNLANFSKKQLVNPLPKSFTKMLKLIQEEFENASTSSRRHSLKYDEIIKAQRDLFYKDRNRVLDADLESDELEELLSNYNIKDTLKQFKNISESKFHRNKTLQQIILYSMDKAWLDHLDALDSLKQGISWRGQNGSNILIIYQNEAQTLYFELIKKIKDNIFKTLSETTSTISKNKNAFTEQRRKGGNAFYA